MILNILWSCLIAIALSIPVVNLQMPMPFYPMPPQIYGNLQRNMPVGLPHPGMSMPSVLPQPGFPVSSALSHPLPGAPSMSASVVPFPAPAPVAMRSPPLVVIPFPSQAQARRRRRPRPRRKPTWTDKDSSCEDSSDTESESRECVHKKHRRRKKSRRYGSRSYHSSPVESDSKDNVIVKPVLNFLSQDGEVKLEKSLSKDEAEELINDGVSHRVDVSSPLESEEADTAQLLKDYDNKPTRRSLPRRVILKSGYEQHMLGEGRKELVFRPPATKKISNLSVSFQVE